MKNIIYGIIFGLVSIAAYPCPFIFINDTRKTVVLLDQNSQAKTMILPGQTKQIPESNLNLIIIYGCTFKKK